MDQNYKVRSLQPIVISNIYIIFSDNYTGRTVPSFLLEILELQPVG